MAVDWRFYTDVTGSPAHYDTFERHFLNKKTCFHHLNHSTRNKKL